MSDSELVALVLHPHMRLSWLLDVLRDRVQKENAPKTLAYLLLAAEAAKEEFDPPSD